MVDNKDDAMKIEEVYKTCEKELRVVIERKTELLAQFDKHRVMLDVANRDQNQIMIKIQQQKLRKVEQELLVDFYSILRQAGVPFPNAEDENQLKNFSKDAQSLDSMIKECMKTLKLDEKEFLATAAKSKKPKMQESKKKSKLNAAVSKRNTSGCEEIDEALWASDQVSLN